MGPSSTHERHGTVDACPADPESAWGGEGVEAGDGEVEAPGAADEVGPIGELVCDFVASGEGHAASIEDEFLGAFPAAALVEVDHG